MITSIKRLVYNLTPKVIQQHYKSYRDNKLFYRDSLLMIDFLKKINHQNISNIPKNTEVFWIVITPWMYTAVPWYALTIALMLRKKGINVHLVWDDLVFDDLALDQENSSNMQNKAIEAVLDIVSGFLPILRISQFEECPLDEKDLNELKRLAEVGTIHKFKSSMPSDLTRQYSEDWFLSQQRNLRKIKGLFNKYSFDRILLPGGVYGNSGLYFHLCSNKEKVSTYDCGLSRALVCVNGITGYQADVPTCLNSDEFKEMSLTQKQTVIELASRELAMRKDGVDAHETQITPVNGGINIASPDIVIALNIAWDLPALGKHLFFKNDLDWVVETVNFILNETDATVAVRQHPHERRHASGRDFSSVITKMFGSSERFRFYTCDDPVNTYQLLSQSSILLPYVSTIGIEGALFGRTVIMEGDSYYSNFSFVQKATSKSDYFERIGIELKHPSKLSEDQIEDAMLTYYITQLCTAEATYFTPHPINFIQWVGEDFEELARNPSLEVIITALAQRVPVALLNHRKYIATN
tara:strand:- start:21803 stop:23377 length:1575 start_codon:yes stop_codon:yes gene_type:complete